MNKAKISHVKKFHTHFKLIQSDEYTMPFGRCCCCFFSIYCFFLFLLIFHQNWIKFENCCNRFLHYFYFYFIFCSSSLVCFRRFSFGFIFFFLCSTTNLILSRKICFFFIFIRSTCVIRCVPGVHRLLLNNLLNWVHL